MTAAAMASVPIQADVAAMSPRPQLVDTLDLIALPSAVVCGSIFAASTLSRWNARFLEADALVLVRELLTVAVNATAPGDGVNWHTLDHLNPITVRLLGYKASVVIEVWDTASEPPPFPTHRGELDEPTGLELVDLIAERWGSSRTPQGRVLWAELAVHKPTTTGLPVRQQGRHSFPPASPPLHNHPSQDPDFLRRVRDGLERL